MIRITICLLDDGHVFTVDVVPLTVSVDKPKTPGTPDRDPARPAALVFSFGYVCLYDVARHKAVVRFSPALILDGDDTAGVHVPAQP